MERMGSVLCTWVKLLTDLQTVGCELRAFGGRAPPLGGRAPPLHAGAAIALPQPLYRGRERARKALGIGRSRKGREGNDIKGYGEMGRGGGLGVSES